MTAERPIHRGATREEQIVAEQAADLAERRGIDRGIALSIQFLESTDHHAATAALRGAILIEAQKGD